MCPHKEKHLTKCFNLLLANVSSGSKTISGLKLTINSSTAPNIENEYAVTPTKSLTSTLSSTNKESVSTNHVNFETADVLLEDSSAVPFIVSLAPEVSAKKQKTFVQTMVPIDEDQSKSE